jgi:molecular chaperone DnaK
MRKDAEAHKAEDVQRKELVEARNTGDSAAYTAEKTVKDLGDKVTAERKTEIADAVAKVRGLLAGEDAAAIKSATEALMEIVQKLGAEAYQQGGASPQGEPGSGSTEGGSADGKGGEDVVEGEFKEA